MPRAIRLRVVIEFEVAEGTTFVEAAEIVDSLPALLIQNHEIKEATLVAIERSDRSR